jgi:hypothetical protein
LGGWLESKRWWKVDGGGLDDDDDHDDTASFGLVATSFQRTKWLGSDNSCSSSSKSRARDWNDGCEKQVEFWLMMYRQNSKHSRLSTQILKIVYLISITLRLCLSSFSAKSPATLS